MYTNDEFKLKVNEWLFQEGYAKLGIWEITDIPIQDSVSIYVRHSVTLSIEDVVIKQSLECTSTTLRDQESIRTAVIAIHKALMTKEEEFLSETE